MKITVSVTIQADDGTPAVASGVFTLEREALAPGSLGLLGYHAGLRSSLSVLAGERCWAAGAFRTAEGGSAA